MGNRKENIKKSLGISEYPWSSDEEDHIALPRSSVRHVPSETRSSAPNMPGPSGTQSTQHPPAVSSTQSIMRSQNRMERDIFWSLLNHSPHRVSSVTIPRNRLEVPSSLVHRSVHHTPSGEARSTTERSSPAADFQRILTFKTLTRNLGALRSSKSATNMLYPVARGSGSSGRHVNTIFNPPTPTTAVTNNIAAMIKARALRRAQSHSTEPGSSSRPGPSTIPQSSRERHTSRTHEPSSPQTSRMTKCRMGLGCVREASCHVRPESSTVSSSSRLPDSSRMPESNRSSESSRNVATLTGAFVDEPQATSSGLMRPRSALSTASRDLETSSAAIDHSDDDLATNTLLRTMSPMTVRDDNNMECNQDVPQEDVIPVNTSGVSLEEEIVEIEAETSADAAVDAGADEDMHASDAQASGDSAPAEEIPNANAAVDQTQQTSHGVKRKREDSEDNTEPNTVKQFNQNLLRLLECPVCLEWMEPPMTQCRRGHLVCGRCRMRLAACPVCRTGFSSVRNRAMEGVAEMLRYPCRYGCGREVRLRRRAPHESSCASRRYHCVVPSCAGAAPMPHLELAQHFQSKHLPIVKIGRKHRFALKVNAEKHDNWLIMALHELFHLRIDVDMGSWGVMVSVVYIGPKRNAKNYSYEITILGQHNSRKLIYTRATHCDVESAALPSNHLDYFHLSIDQALNYLRVKDRRSESDGFLNINVEIANSELNPSTRDDSES